MQRLLRLCILSVLLVSGLVAQTFRGSIQGTVTDQTGATIPNASVKITSVDSGLTRDVVTNAQGEYIASELPLGNYNVTVSLQGFRTQTVKNVQVSVGTTRHADVQLATGEVKETVEVTADAPLIETTTNTMGGTIEGKQAAELPVNGGDFTKLLVLVPGATGDPVGSVDSPGSFGLFSANGNRGRSNNYLLDGTDMNDAYRNLPSINEAGVYGTPATILPVDALAEVPVMSGVGAEYGRNAGAIVNLVTRSGSNELHGSLYERFRNDVLDARNYFNTTDQSKNAFHNNQFGGSAGGPVFKDRTFWFVAYEGQRESGSQPTSGTLPTLADIADATARIGAANVSSVIQSLLAKNPWGMALPATDGTVQFATPFTNRVDSLIVKLDHHLGKDRRDLITGRYFLGDSDQSFPLSLVGGSGANGYNTVTPTRANIVSLSYTKVLSEKMLVEFRGGYNRYHQDFFAQDRSFNPTSIGLNTLGTGTGANDFGMPLISIAGYSSLGANLSVPRGRIDSNYQLFTNASYTSGKHNWKTGVEFRRAFINQFFDAGYRGKLTFDSLDAFLEGAPSSGRSAQGNSKRYTYQNNVGVYLQDSWRLTSKLTMNYGLRWDYYGVIGEKYNRLSILNAAGNIQYVGTNGLDSLYPKDWNNFGPRVSFAYDVTGKGKTVIRAGWGVYYDAFSHDFFTGQLPWNTFSPGPAYNDVQFSSTPNPISSANPVFTDYASSDVWTVDQKMRTPYIQNYNLNVEHQLSSVMAVQVGYVGSAGRKLFRYRDLNQMNSAGDVAYPGYIYVNQFEASAASHYDSLQTSFKIRNWHGLTSTLNYTLAHSIDNASDGQDYVPNAAQPDNSFNPGAERASSNFDTRHRIQWFWTYNLPAMGSSRLVKGWAIDGVVTHATGQPFNVNYMYEGDYNGSGEWFGRPDLVGNPYAGVSTPGALLNLNAFAAPCTVDASGTCLSGTQHFGNVGRNAFRGPNYTNFDFSISKDTKFFERLNMQLRVDFFNVLNHANFANPVVPNFYVDMFNNGSAISGNRLTGTGFLPTLATPDVATGNPFLGGGGPRNIQLGAKFTF